MQMHKDKYTTLHILRRVPNFLPLMVGGTSPFSSGPQNLFEVSCYRTHTLNEHYFRLSYLFLEINPLVRLALEGL